jgi:hypothetical protein
MGLQVEADTITVMSQRQPKRRRTGRMEGAATVRIEGDPVAGTAQHPTFERAVVQGRAPAPAWVFQDDALLITDDQQQLTATRLASPALAILLVDPALQRDEPAPSSSIRPLHL